MNILCIRIGLGRSSESHAAGLMCPCLRASIVPLVTSGCCKHSHILPITVSCMSCGPLRLPFRAHDMCCLLQAHTWPGLRMKPHSDSLSNGLSTRHSAGDIAAAGLPISRAEQQSPNAAAAADAPAVLSTAAAAAVDSEPRANGVPAGPSQDSNEQHGSHGVTMNGHDTGQEHAAASSRLSDFAGSDTASEGSDSREDTEMDGFERMMRQLRQERNHLQGLPDVERRARAASMAAQMMQAFGINDEDSEDAGSPP